jgi:N-glycosylase/DNA lyase
MSEPMSLLALPARGFDLDATLASGQAFCWKRDEEGWRGWIEGRPCRVQMEGDRLRALGPGLTAGMVTRYFGLDAPMEKIFAAFPDDPWLARARDFAPGLRILRQDPWETLCNFICSSLKRIVQIGQINQELRREFGPRIAPDAHDFPSAARLAQATEEELRACRLGFRARHLFVAARQIAAGEVSLERIAALPTGRAREELCRLRGVGAKVADCVLLFAYGRMEAFPIDVWVERVLRRLYFKDRARSHPKMALFVERHFGPYRGYAQQFLFHWIRNDPLALPPPGKKAAPLISP